MQVFGIKLWDKSQKDFLVEIERGLKASKKIWIATVNPEFMVESWRDKRFFKILTEKTSYNVIDGNGLLWAAKLGRKSLITGVELMDELCAMAEKERIPVYFLGGWEPEKVAEFFVKKYNKLKVVGIDKELYKGGRIGRAILFIALGMKKQEFWIEDNWDKLSSGVVVGVGRSFDYYAGSINRAPKWLRDMRLEWLFSALMDRKRAWRQLKNLPWFVWRVIFKKV